MTDKYADLGFARLDLSRSERTGFPETIYCAGKTQEQLLGILQKFRDEKIAVMGTRCSAEKYEFIQKSGLNAVYDPISRIIFLNMEKPNRLPGKIAVCAAGTADLPVAEEAARAAEFFGAKVERFYDVGIAGLHRLLSQIDAVRQADVIIAVAGMEGALPSVISGLTDTPVIAVPTSIGYGASLKGITPLMAMLSSCAEGISVVNIDNGFGAAVSACKFLRKLKEHD